MSLTTKMKKYELAYETHGGRCAWCWEPLGEVDSHSVVRASSAPLLELRFHHNCWAAYRAVSAIEQGAVGIGGDWPPERIERLRLFCGLPTTEFVRVLHTSKDRYCRILARDKSAWTYELLGAIKRFAIRQKFEQDTGVDWSNPCAVFCLRKDLNWTVKKLARELGSCTIQVHLWDKTGVPLRSLRARARLSRLAAKVNFDTAMVWPDRLWDKETLCRLYETSGKTQSEWAMEGRTSLASFWGWLHGRRTIYRESGWHLTRAATTFNLPLPPIGDPVRRSGPWNSDNFPVERPRVFRWNLDDLMRLGTEPDRILGKKIGKSRVAVALMRCALDIPCVDFRKWDGRTRDAPLAREEVERRWLQYQERCRARTAGQRREVS